MGKLERRLRERRPGTHTGLTRPPSKISIATTLLSGGPQERLPPRSRCLRILGHQQLHDAKYEVDVCDGAKTNNRLGVAQLNQLQNM